MTVVKGKGPKRQLSIMQLLPDASRASFEWFQIMCILTAIPSIFSSNHGSLLHNCPVSVIGSLVLDPQLVAGLFCPVDEEYNVCYLVYQTKGTGVGHDAMSILQQIPYQTQAISKSSGLVVISSKKLHTSTIKQGQIL